jgi:signal transduction histidine kinase/ActR/RegA family two-component response regulator
MTVEDGPNSPIAGRYRPDATGRSQVPSVSDFTPERQNTAAWPLSRAPDGATRALALERSEVSVYESVKWLSLCLVGVFFGYALYHLSAQGHSHGKTIVLLDAAALSVDGAICLGLFLRRIKPRWAHPVGAIIALTTALNVLLSAAARHSMVDLAYVPFMLVAVGAIVLSPYWLAIIAGAILTLAVPVARHVLPDVYIVDYFVSVLGGAALMMSVFVNRVRTHQHVMRLRDSDLQLAASLREALERSELRLREQQQTDRRRQELEDQLRQAQKLEAVGVLAGGVAHDMNNVLGVITSIASLASDRIEPNSPLNQDVEDILAAARRGSALTRNLLGFARQGKRLTERFRMETTVESIAHLLRRTISKQVELHVDASSDLDDIVGDPGQLSHVLMNLCINAVDATQGRGTINVRATNLWVNSELALVHDIPVGRYIELSVEDNGSGIPPDVLPRVFEPFFSTKTSNERSGLGLSMVYGTVRDHGGAIHIDSTVGCGTKVRIILPSQVKRPASIAPPAIRAVRPSDARRTILLVDDEPLLRSAGRRIIKSMRFEPLVAANGAEAVAVFRHQHESIALVVLDVAMPVMGGRDCFWRLREIDPEVPVLVASGYAKHGDVEELLAAGATGYLSKPYDRDQMTTAIHRCLSLSLTIAVAKVAPEDEPSPRNAAIS